MGDEHRVQGVSPSSSTSARQAQVEKLRAQGAAELQAIEITENAETMVEKGENILFNPMAMLKNADTLERRMRRQEFREPSSAQQGDDDQDTNLIDNVGKIAEEFQDRNPEMQKRALLNLVVVIHPDDGPEEILAKILRSYPDPFLADEALLFLIETTDPNTKIAKNVGIARELLNARFGREVRAGRNINTEAREFAKQGLGTPTTLRDLYRDITGNPREPISLFEELSESFPFEKMKTVLQFMLHSLGSDLKSKGPSIAPAELQRLFSETRTMQAILGIYRFFFQRMKLIEGAFNREDLTLPKKITFELLAKQFVKLLGERYPSPDKILRLSALIGISEEVIAQIIIFTQFRDALRGVSPRLFKSDKHRQDLLAALIETLSELEDLLEEEQEEGEEKEEKKKPGWEQKDTID